MLERLQNILSHRGVASRRGAATLIEAGRVKVDGTVVREPGARFAVESARIEVDGRQLEVERERTRTIMMYKPVGVTCTMHDEFSEQTVHDLLKDTVPERLVPVGRLDKDSEGMLILSNDGDLTLKLTHPRFEHEKEYLVRVAGRWSEEKLQTLRSPLVIDGYRIRPCQVEVIRLGENNVHLLRFVLREGRKRQIRRMCSEAHLVVLMLKRVRVGALQLDSTLASGEWRDLQADEIAALLRVDGVPTTTSHRDNNFKGTVEKPRRNRDKDYGKNSIFGQQRNHARGSRSCRSDDAVLW